MPQAAQFLPDKKTLEYERGVDLAVCQCTGCGLIQLDGDPVPYYREVIRAAAFSQEMQDYRLKQFTYFIQQYSLTGKKVIEIGCGRGEYLALIQQSGVDAYGLEYAPASVEYCVQNSLQVACGFVGGCNQELDHAPFAAFFSLNFLEHLPDPNTVLRGIYHNLVDDAVGLVEVPNFDMIIRSQLFSEFINDHLFYFTKKTLTTLLEINGFEIIECNETWHDYIISATVRKRQKIDLSNFYACQKQLKQQFADYFEQFKNKKVAVWGAGHQALTILSLMNLVGKIKYVVDSATFKQGKYTPATHIPIVSPDTLITDPVDAIIIMAASYSDEVIKILQEKFAQNICIFVLRDFKLKMI